MKNKGFTIVEIVAVIVLLALVMILVIPSVINSSDEAKTRIYDTKIKMIRKSAVMYAQDNYSTLVSGCSDTCTRNILVKDLVPNYIVRDNEEGTGCAVDDPRSKGQCLDTKSITITINKSTKKITTSVN